MPAIQTASLPLSAWTFADRVPLLGFLARELAPFPGRAIATGRVVIESVVVLVLCMTLQIPEAHLAVWVVTRVAMEDASQSLLAGIVVLIALTIGLAVPLVFLTFAMDQPWLRFCLMAGLTFGAFFLRQTFVVGVAGFVIGLIGTMIMTLPDFIPIPELAVRASLWLWPVFALGIATAVAGNLLIAPSDPQLLLVDALRMRVRAAEDALARWIDGDSERSEASRLAQAGIARLLMLLKSAEVVHPSLKAQHLRHSALITLADRLVSNAAALEHLPRVALDVDDRLRLQQIAESCARVRRAFDDGRVTEIAPSIADAPTASRTPPVFPLIGELEHVVEQMHQALGPDGVRAEVAASESRGLLAGDAFTNPDYVRYALKGTLAVMTCYVLQSAVDWPGIRTCIITCLIVGLGSEGATVQKGTLRIAGALVGAAMGFAAIMFLIPGMESITSLTMLVAAGTAVAAWVTLGSPRIAYAGVQIAFAFFVCVIQGWEPSWHFDTIRDRLIGILLGNAVITLVFHYVWPLRAGDAMWRSLASALRTMAKLAALESRGGDKQDIVTAAHALRLQASRDFTTAQQSADQSGFELGDAGPERLAARERLQRTTADAQSVLLTQLAIAHQWPSGDGAVLPEALTADLRRFDHDLANALDVAADRAEHGEPGPIPDLRARLAAVTAATKERSAAIADAEVAAQIAGRLALYDELVPRIARLGADLST